MLPGSPNPENFYTHFIDLVSVSNSHDRGHKCDVHVYKGVNYVIIALKVTLNDIFWLLFMYRWVNPASPPPKYIVFASSAPILTFLFGFLIS